ncbi:50S ribosomal protein L17 [Candidatus Gottesmanbacteria bacterium RIFCSPHIGHO2_02_FULL_40_13]|uniref:50S ribosomal protein L17 n=1 Tax=Candidatus Gottesmanbacteria bacterium RIFCSPHIGHO2_02_FULL_40_13 TaxID=1798384 RepID=A0A1F6A8A6_9BACT|nr:MAG: 50S ribosomal protein L17 [Candidatus Gottesmanbacteria bacterium RIFCSPHIGHO2_02_FULL_40_13]
MRHQVFGRKLNRDVKERKALFRSLVSALITKGKIKTTLAKAKAIRGLAEKLVTLAKKESSAGRMKLTSFLIKSDLVKKIIQDIAPKFLDRKGGYVRIRRIGQRIGDNAEEVFLEWTFNKEEVKDLKTGKKPVKKQEKNEENKKGKI